MPHSLAIILSSRACGGLRVILWYSLHQWTNAEWWRKDRLRLDRRACTPMRDGQQKNKLDYSTRQSQVRIVCNRWYSMRL